MSKRVWLATCGEYSDYRVIAAFRDEQRAREWVRLWNRRAMDDDGCAIYSDTASLESVPADLGLSFPDSCTGYNMSDPSEWELGKHG